MSARIFALATSGFNLKKITGVAPCAIQHQITQQRSDCLSITHMGASNGWERANWFAQPGDDTSHAATQSWGRNGRLLQRIVEECHAVRDAAGILDLPGFSRYRLSGARA